MKENRSLCHVELVTNVEPIAGADRCESISILGWKTLAKKNEFKIGDKVVYFEIDSKVPETAQFEFLRNKKFKIKTQRYTFGGNEPFYSQGLVMTFDQLGLDSSKYSIGDDMTGKLGITKIETDEERRLKKDESKNFDNAVQSMKARHKKLFQNKIIKKLMRHTWFRKLMFALLGKKNDKPKAFPSYIHKTDETRVENMPWVLNDQEKKWQASEKVDGTSTTVAVDCRKKKVDFVVCSRNVRQVDMNQETYHDSNVYWEMAFKYDLKNVLLKFREKYASEYPIIILQGETFGESLQGNPYKMNYRDFMAYNLVLCDPSKGIYQRLGSQTAKKFMEEFGVKWVPLLDVVTLPSTMTEMKSEAEGNSVINPKVLREGIVYRSLDGQESFKNVSNTYLMKHQE